MRHIDCGADIAGDRTPERIEDRDRLRGAGAQPREGIENLVGPRDLEKTGGAAALA